MCELNSGTPCSLKNFSSSASCEGEDTKSVCVSYTCCTVKTYHTVQPRQKLLSAVVGVEDNGDAVCGRNGADVVGTSNGSLDGSALVLVVDTLTSEVCGSSLGHLEDDGRLGIAGCLEGCNDGRRGGYVDSGDGVSLGLSVLEESVDLDYVNGFPEVRIEIESHTSSP